MAIDFRTDLCQGCGSQAPDTLQGYCFDCGDPE